MKQQECVFNQCKQFTQAIAATDSCTLGQPDHAKSEHLPGGRNRAAATMPLRFTSAMQTCTKDATPEPAKQTGWQRAPGKVQLWLDLIQRAPCFTMQPLGFRAKTIQADKAQHHTERAANTAAAITIPQWLLCQTSAIIPQLQCKQVQLQYVQSNATCNDAVPSNATAGGNQSRS